jgi:methylated-DNA-[protein]-cysteine S-methyltransferase
MKEFQSRVLELTSKIPKGKVTTYAEIARAMAKPRAYRAVANALANNPYPIKIPCHRVVRSSGEVGGYAGSCTSGTRKKTKLLKSEGVEIEGFKVLLPRHMFRF